MQDEKNENNAAGDEDLGARPEGTADPAAPRAPLNDHWNPTLHGGHDKR
ncbi:hypothetical protein AB4225_11555 [Streptomyces sp. 2RAF24]